MSYGILFTI